MIRNDKKQIAIILSVVHWQVARKTEEYVQLSVPFIPSTLLSSPSLKSFFSGLYNPGRVEKSRYLCNQSARLLSLGAESFSRFELIAGWNVIKVRVEVAPHEDAATSRKRKFLPLVLIRASLPPFLNVFPRLL